MYVRKFLKVEMNPLPMTKAPTKNTLRKAAKRAVDVAMSKDPSRGPVTLSLRREGYKRLRDLCRDQGWSVSRVLDDLVEAFLEAASEE
jgi:hypothetical protein